MADTLSSSVGRLPLLDEASSIESNDLPKLSPQSRLEGGLVVASTQMDATGHALVLFLIQLLLNPWKQTKGFILKPDI